jgi:hypothetical protein
MQGEAKMYVFVLIGLLVIATVVACMTAVFDGRGVGASGSRNSSGAADFADFSDVARW